MNEEMLRYDGPNGFWNNWPRQIFLIAVILSILAAITIPNIFHFSPRAKQSEAKTNLGSIFNAQQDYYGEYNTYAGGPNCFELLGWRAEGDSLYSYYCGQDHVDADKQNAQVAPCVGVVPQTSRESFTVCAAGNIDRDATIDVWSMRDSKFLKNDLNDVGK